MEAKAIARHVRVTPRKARRMVDLIRGKKATEAITILKFAPQDASLPVRIIFRAHRARRSPPGGGLGRTKHKMSINPIKETKHLPIRKRI